MTVKCSRCQYENRPGAVYCGKCGAQLAQPGAQPLPSTATFQKPLKDLTRGSLLSGRYEVIEKLGKGAMGDVYRVFDRKIEEEIVIKVLNPEASDEKTVTRFRNELKFARKVTHRNVCRMYDIHEEGTSSYITMEYVPGEDLKSMIRMTKQLSLGTALHIAKQVCEGLAEAHKLDVVHRDLKPSNIMIDKEGNARIMDFGIARSLKAEGLTGAGVMIGTPEYMSPEQAEGKKADQRSDIYSLGVILYEMVTGKLPFEGETPLSIALKHKTENPQNPRELNSQIPQDLSQLILRCMEKEREKRYQTAEEILTELNRIEKGLPHQEVILPRGRPKDEKFKPVNWKAVLIYSSVGLIFGFLVIAAISFFSPKEEIIDSIAVLPFENVNADIDTEYLSDGITESIISRLTQLPSLKKVIARSSVFRYKGRQVDPQAVGHELGVDTVLVSRMRRYGDELVISVELVKVQDNRHIWGERYVRNISEVFDVQEEITNSIADNLQLKLTGEEIERLRKHYTQSSEAFIAYTRGQFFWNRRTEEDLLRAIEYFEEALRIDPNYALAYIGLANSYLLLPEYGTYPSGEAYPIVKENVHRALEIDDTLAEAHVALAQIMRRYDYDWTASEREYKRGIELDPNYATAHHWYGYDLMCRGQYDEAISEIRRAHELDPLSLVINRNLGQVFYRARRYDEAREALRKTLEMDPNFSFTHFYLGSIHLQNSNYEEALVEFRKEKEIAKGWGGRVDVWIGVTYAKMGQREKAQDILNKLIEESRQRYVPSALFAVLYFSLGDDDSGFQWLERGYKEYDSWMRLLKIDPVFDRVRADPKFREMLVKIGLED